MNTISQGLLITLIGMGLVFLAIVLLWGLMSLMVRLGAEKDDDADQEETSTASPAEPAVSKKRLAAAAAVALALADRAAKYQLLQKPAETPGNIWQAAQRAQVLQGKANIFTSRSTRR
jgi:Na+-transporting methylmalonyl-CoA/oxaloacetate decarboxylase gamma subunit